MSSFRSIPISNCTAAIPASILGFSERTLPHAFGSQTFLSSGYSGGKQLSTSSAGRGAGSFQKFIQQQRDQFRKNRLAVLSDEKHKEKTERSKYNPSQFKDADVSSAENLDDNTEDISISLRRSPSVPADVENDMSLEEFTANEIKKGFRPDPDDPDGAREYFEYMKYCHENPVTTIEVKAKVGKGGLHYKRARTLHELVAELQMPADLSVKPGDEEYGELSNFWNAIARNPSYTGYQKRLMIVRLANYMSARHNKSYEKILMTAPPEAIRMFGREETNISSIEQSTFYEDEYDSEED